MFGWTRLGPRRGADLEIELELPIERIASGGDEDVRFARPSPGLQSMPCAPATPPVANWTYHDCVTFAQSRSRINAGSYLIKGGEFIRDVNAHIENALVKATER